MASLVENLISVLEQENTEYEALLELSRKKTPVIVQGDIVRLQEITDEEQNIIDRIYNLEMKREGHVRDIADVINRDVKTGKPDSDTGEKSGRAESPFGGA